MASGRTAVATCLPAPPRSLQLARPPPPSQPQPLHHQPYDVHATQNALNVITAYNALAAAAAATTTVTEQTQWDAALATVAGGGVDMDDYRDELDMLVDPELVRALVQSGSADAIAAEQAAKAVRKRRNQCENMVRYRLNKKTSFADMKVEEKRLAAQLQALLHAHMDGAHDARRQEQELAHTDASALPVSTQAARTQQTLAKTTATSPSKKTTLTNIRDAYAQVLLAKERLHYENAWLRNGLASFYKFQHMVEEAHAQEAEDKARMRKAHYEREFGSPSGRWVRFLEHDEPFYFVPFKHKECCAIAMSTLDKIYAHQSSYLTRSGRCGATVMKLFDWTASLQFEWDEAVQLTMIKYQFKKTFRNPQHTVEQLVDANWKIFNDDDHFVHVHRVPVFSQMLQKVDANMSVRLWNAPEPMKSLRFRNVSLFTRSRYTNPFGKDCGIVTVTGVQLKNFREQGLQSLDEFCKKHSENHDGGSSDGGDDDDDDSAVYTHGGFVYMTFVNDDNGDMEVEFGGRVDITSEEQGRFLMVELGGTCIRLEHMLFPFRVIK